MSKKDPHYQREANKYANPIPSREFIIKLCADEDIPLNFNQIFRKLGLRDRSEDKALQNRLRAMLRDGQLMRDKKGRYTVADASELLVGYVIGHKDGFGFVALDQGGDDLYLSPQEMRSLFPGDRVEARVIGTDRKGRQEGTVSNIVERRTHEIAGRVYFDNKKAYLNAYDKRIVQDVCLGLEQDCRAKASQLVVAKITQQPSRFQAAQGEIIEILGDHMAPGLEIELAMRAHELPHKWPQAVLDETNVFADTVKKRDLGGRKDLRQLPFVTIDGEDAKDFDDAVYCEPRESGGFCLYVAIADVSHYVKSNSALDEEALLRGNSVYFPGRVIPMLPEALSNGLCSLKPEVDRLVMVCEMCIDTAGKITCYKFYDGVIHSHARMTYEQVWQILSGNTHLREQYQTLVPYFENLYQLYHILYKCRQKRGAIEFSTTETRVLFNERGKIREIVPVERNDAHKIIEECMLCANVCAAKFILKNEHGNLYRIHLGPNPDKLNDLRKSLNELGLSLKGRKDDIQPIDYSNFLSEIADLPNAQMINTLLLRSLSQAVYSDEPEGHFGLAYEIYTHFTSPIRRYPDLIVHRIIRSILSQRKRRLYSDKKIAVYGEHCSTTERRADDATRDAMDWLKCEYMLDKVGEDFQGIVTAVTQFGLFVQLDKVYVEGLLHVTNLNDDYYHYDAISQALIAERSGKRFHLGDPIHIRVAKVDLDSRQVDFVLAKANKAKPKTKKKTKKKRKKHK